MNTMTEEINIKRLLQLIAIVLLGLYALHAVPQEQEDGLLEERIVRSGEKVPAEEDWTLSLYKGGAAIVRISHTSFEMCLSAGDSYVADKTADDFHCAHNCEEFRGLKRIIWCERVCDAKRECRPAYKANTSSLDD